MSGKPPLKPTKDFLNGWLCPSVYLMNQVLLPFLNKFVMVYFDDLIYSLNEKDHLHHLKLLFTALQENDLQINLKKCSFLTRKIQFLGFIIIAQGISVDPKKIESTFSWPTPFNPKDIQCFLGLLAFFYRRFIRAFSSSAAPLTNCLERGQVLWSQTQERQF